MELKQKIISGLGWNLGTSFFNQGLGFVSKIILARLLFPEDFGLFALAYLVIQSLSLFLGLGVFSALIYKEEKQQLYNAGFFLSVLSGVILSLIAFFSKNFVASFFNNPHLSSLIAVLSIVLFFDSVSGFFSSILIKNFSFKRKAIGEILSAIAYNGSVIALAWAGYGVWSLVWSFFVQHLLLMIFFWIFSQQKVSLRSDSNAVKELLHFGKYITSNSILAWIIVSIDNIIVGRKLGSEQVGYYSFSFNIATLPILSVSHIVASVFHPVYAKVREEKELLKKTYIRPLEYSLFIMIPLSLFFLFFAKDFVYFVLGERWLSVILILRIFSVYCVVRTYCTLSSSLLEGIGKPKIITILSAVELSVLVLLIAVLIPKGIMGVAIAVVIARTISVFLYHNALKQVFVISSIEYFYLLWKKVVAAGIMILFFYIVESFLPYTIIGFISACLISGLLYLVALFILEKNFFTDALKELKTIYM